MTISSIYSSLPGAVGNPSDIQAQEAGGNATGSVSRETLQEVTDQTKLSTLAPRIQAMLNEAAGAGGNVLETLSSNIDRLQEGFLNTLYTALAEENIDLTEKLTLRLESDGALSVAGEHPERERMERILEEQPALSEAFGEIASQSEVMRDIANINKVMTRQTGMEAYASQHGAKSSFSVYQMSLKGEMSHFYFSRG